ncbi:MAG TPA: VOC family protein [Longimicrobiales bacterium]|nr:VOC family protein [Longimicrobiales bacterium]
MTLRDVGLGPVRLAVADVDRSATWYGRVLGLVPAPEDAGRGATLGVPGGDALVRLVPRPGARPHPGRGRLGLYHFAVLLPDRASLGAFLAHARALGVPLGAADHGVSEALYTSDPDGLGIEVYADRPVDAWPRSASGGIEMGTAPLDAGSLIAAARDRSWSGAPAGTRMGHVHLHVGDLAEAERFYADGLGLQPTLRGYPGALFLAADGYHHHLGLNTWAGPGATPAGPTEAALLDWEVRLPDDGAVRAAVDRMRSGGFEPLAEGGDSTFEDPWGTRVALRVA